MLVLWFIVHHRSILSVYCFYGRFWYILLWLISGALWLCIVIISDLDVWLVPGYAPCLTALQLYDYWLDYTRDLYCLKMNMQKVHVSWDTKNSATLAVLTSRFGCHFISAAHGATLKCCCHVGVSSVCWPGSEFTHGSRARDNCSLNDIPLRRRPV